jgi:CRP/FNR family transcriptional regulator
MSLVESLRSVQIFQGLSGDELEKIAALSETRTLQAGDVVISEGENSHELFIIERGTIQISLQATSSAAPIVNLGTGQIFGEMTLVDRGARSASAKALSDDTQLLVISHDELLDLCDRNNHIGYVVMRNLAADMSLKLRYANITGQLSADDA